MSIKALQEYTYYSKYARYNKKEQRRETWLEAVDRVKQMHLRKYPQISKQIEWAFEQVENKRVLGSQRALQFGGLPVEKKNARQYNCISSYCDRLRFFQECLWLLLCGCGTGFSVQKHHIAKLPNFSKKPRTNKKVFVIPDTIEGWADSLGILIASYFPNHPDFPQWEGCKPLYDFSEIRSKGSPLSSGAGKAPGPEPLKKALALIENLLDNCVQTQDRLRPIDAYDIIMHASDAVLSGGVRRSATLCMFSPDDDEMVNAKTGNWFVKNPQRGRSNNSAVLLRNKTTKEDFMKLGESVKQFGEPGFIFVDDLESLYNPCVEINYIAYLKETRESGWCACNLCEINGRKIKTKEDFKIACEAAAIIGTIQAGYTNFDYLGEVTKKIVEREALLGVSITGIQDSPDILLDPELQKEMAQHILKVNASIAELIGINPTARATCVKPAGTTSCILGTASGIHPHHAKRYFRRIQANELEPVFQHFKKSNPVACDKSVWSANGTDEVITFCCEVPDGSKTKNDISALDLLQIVKSTQQNWVSYGKNSKKCVEPWLSHNVSNTCNVKEEEWNDVLNYIYDNRQYFAGISLIPQSGDLDYPQAPFTHVLTPREIFQEYGDGSLMASGLIVDGLHAFDGNLWAACDTVLGIGESLEFPEHSDNDLSIEAFRQHELKIKQIAIKQDWVRRVRQFADRYCDGNVKKCTYLMKEVNNWKLWVDLKREYKDVDYTTLIELEDNTKVNETVACSGGKCELA